MTKSSSSSRAQGWRGRRESDSQVFCHVYSWFSDSLQRRRHVAIHSHQEASETTTTTYENWISREMSVLVVAILGSTDTCFATVLFAHFFYVAADSNPEVLLSLLLQNGEACPVDASGCSFALRSLHLETWKCFSTSDDGQHFAPLSAAFFGLLFGVEAVVTGSCQFISTPCGHTHPVSEHV